MRVIRFSGPGVHLHLSGELVDAVVVERGDLAQIAAPVLDAAEPAGRVREIRLSFVMRDMKLYAFRLSEGRNIGLFSLM